MIVKLKNKTEQLLRLFCVNTITLYNDSVLLVEYPKSGGTWLGQLLSSYLKIPFPRNRFPILKRSFFHSHYLPKYNIAKNKKIVYLVRDGRDVMVSLYHHQLIWNEKNKLIAKDVIYHRSKVPFDDYENVQDNMSAFIKYTFEEKPSKWRHFTYMGNWYEYNLRWMQEMKTNKNVYLIKYEDLLEKPIETMHTMLHDFFDEKDVDQTHLTEVVNRFSFENQTRRKQGEENKNSFLRKGIKGDWKNHFNENDKRLFKKYTHNLLIDLNYEKDNNW